MDTVIKIFTLFSPFIAAYIVYLLGIKGKRKETDIQKEKELNIVLSNLLMVWHYLSKIDTVVGLLKSPNPNSIVPPKYYPVIILQTSILNDKYFQELDNSVDVLKKYDPILFYKLEGIGNSLDTIRKKFILPFFKNPDTNSEMITAGAGTLVTVTLKDIEDYLEMVAGKLNADTLAQVRTYIHDHLNSDNEEIVKETNEKYYELMMQIIPDSVGQKPTLDEFVEFAKTDEYKKIVEMQFDIVANDTLEDFIDIVTNNPDISMEQAQAVLDKKRKE